MQYRGLHGLNFSGLGPAGSHGYSLGPSRQEKNKNFGKGWPGPKEKLKFPPGRGSANFFFPISSRIAWGKVTLAPVHLVASR